MSVWVRAAAAAAAAVGGLQQDSNAFWEWAARHQSLQHLRIEAMEETALTAATLCHICELRNTRPGLKVTTVLAEIGSMFHQQLNFG